MKAFDVDLDASIIEAIAAHAEDDYPNEACGLVLGKAGVPELVRAVPMKNMQDEYHRRYPDRFPRTGRDAFRFDDREHARVLDDADREGLVERVIYHSHCDAGAYFSPEDRANAVPDGIELIPGAVYVVVSVRDGRRADAAAFRWVDATQGFEEVRLGFGAAGELPDLAARAMEGKAAARPVRPFGGALAPRRVTGAERDRISAIAEKTQFRVDDAERVRDLERFELGLYSPLAGFLRGVELRSIEQSGRLLSGTPWRAPVTLEIAAKKSAVLPAVGSVIELVDPSGRALAAMGLQELVRVDKETVRLAGPVFVYDSGSKRDAPETRAELLRYELNEVLAVGPKYVARAREADLSEFAAVLAPEPLGAETRPRWLPLPLPGRDPWLDAVMAQNLGATHVWVEDSATARAIEETLDVRPWRPGGP